MQFMRIILLTLGLLLGAALAQKNEKFNLFNNEWCGDENCYDILKSTRSSERTDIKQVYNDFSKRLHPDKNPNQTEADRQLFLKVVRAWEILGDTARREQYNEYLRLKSAIDSPRESPIIVFILLYAALTFVVLQYKKQTYNTIRKNILTNGKVQRQILDSYNLDLSGRKVSKKKKDKKKSKKGSSSNLAATGSEEDSGEEKSVEDQVTNEMINAALKAEKIIVPGWTGVEPDYKIAAKAIPQFFVWAAQEGYFQIRWQVRYTLLKWPYTDLDREYLCRVAHKYDLDAWKKLSGKQRTTMLRRAGPWRKGQKVQKKNSKAE